MAWRGSVWLWWCGKSVRCGGWNGGHEESEEAPRRFFLRGGVFHPPKGNVLKLPKWFNSNACCFLPLHLWAGGASRSTEGNLIEWFTHLNSGQWLNPSFNPQLSDAHCYIEGGNAAPHKWRRGATCHHPKGERDESTATHTIEGEKHHHSNGGGIKQHHPHKGGKQPQPKGWWNHFWVCIALSFPPFVWWCFSPLLLLVGGVFPLSLFWRDVASSPLLLLLVGGALFPSLQCVVVCPNILLWRGAVRAAQLDYAIGLE